jgi:hypothetical protein
MRPLSPKKEPRRRNSNTKEDKPVKLKRKRTSEPDQWDGGGGSVYHSSAVGINAEIDATLVSKKHVEDIKRDLKGSGRDRDLRRKFKNFAPTKPTVKPPVLEISLPPADIADSKAFDAKRVRGIGFDPRRRANEEVKLSDKKVSPIVGHRISLDGVLGEMNNNENTRAKDEVDSDSDSDLDIVMANV